MYLTAEELIAGSGLKLEVEIPPEVLDPGGNGGPRRDDGGHKVKLRPLTVKDIQLIARAAKNDEVLTSVLMIQQATLEPKLKQEEIARMHGGLVRFLVDTINRISGLRTDGDELREITQAPIVQAFFVLAKEFNWTPEQVRQMTVGQILSYLELLNQTKRGV